MSSDRGGIVALGVIAAYNVVQNVALPEWAYVPANLAVTTGLVGLGRHHGVSWDEMGLGTDDLGRGVRIGSAVAATVGVSMLVGSSHRRLGRLFLDERARGHGRGEAVYRSAVRFPLGTALFEEVAFRGVLDALWRRRGVGSARVITALAFGLWHLIPTYREYPGMAAGVRTTVTSGERGVAAVAGAVITTIAGFGFTALREGAGSVAAPWLAHAAYNTSAYVAARGAWRRTAEQAFDGGEEERSDHR